jgi:glycosyltransferase involved in cell wall biosynthesis
MKSVAKASDCAKVFGPPKPMELPPLSERPLVSILISNYNYASYLEAAVVSSIEQTSDRLEVVVCDDGSTDTSSEILSRAQARDQRIKVIHQQNGGQSLALNAAFQTCVRDVICLLDTDDVFMPDKVKRVVDAFAAAPHCGLAVNRVLGVDRTRRYLGEVPLLSPLASGWMRPFLSLTAPHVAPGLPPSSGLSLRRHVAEALSPLPAGLRAYADTLIQVRAPLLTPVVGIETPLGRFPNVNHFWNPKTVSSLGDRVGLWRHLTAVTLSRSPWLGLGYYSVSRIYGPEYNPGLGTAHSMFVEVLAGGGVLSFTLLIALCLTVSAYAIRLLYFKRDRLSFATSSLLLACVLFGSMGEEIDSRPAAIGFWYCAAVLSWLYEQHAKVAIAPAERHKSLPMGVTALPNHEAL